MSQTAPGSSRQTPYFVPRRFAHANLFVDDYEKSAAFYKRVVGIEEVYRQPNNMAVFLSNGNTYHDLALTSKSSKYAAPDHKAGIWHYAFELETEAALVEGYEAAVADRLPIAFVMDHDVARSVYLSDPDRNLVEMTADVEKDWRPMRSGVIIKDKPKWVPGVTSVPLTEKNYPQNPEIVVVKEALFHPTKVAHLAMVADDFEKMFDYYVGPAGLAPVLGDRTSSAAVFRGTVGAEDFAIYRKGDGLSPGYHHLGFEVRDEADLAASIRALPASGVTVERVLDHPARLAVTVRDLDGLFLQFFTNRKWDARELAGLDADTARFLL